MNVRMRRLITGGLSAMAVFWATRSGVAASEPHVRTESAPAKAASTSGGEIRLACGDSRTYSSSSEIQLVEVEDTEIVGVSAGGNELTITGLKPGTTKATVWYAASEKPVQIAIRIGSAKGDSQPTEIRVASETGPSRSDSSSGQASPAVSVESSNPVQARIGEIMEQEIIVKNIGSVPAEQVEVRGNVSIDSELISTEPKAEVVNSSLVWKLSRIPTGGQQKIIVRVRPLIAGELSCQTNVSFKSTGSTKPQAAEPKLKLTFQAPNAVPLNSEVRIRVNVSNVGTAAATGVRVRQIVPGVMQAAAESYSSPLSLEVGTLQPGETRVLETASIAREPGTVRVNLIAQTEDGYQTAAEQILRVTTPKLAIAATGPETRNMNQRASYQFTVVNPGDAPATNVNVMIGLPEGLEFLDANGNAVYNTSKRTVAWAVGTLEPQQRREFTVNVMAQTEGQHLQRVVAWADGNLLAKADKLTRVEGILTLDMEISDVEDPIQVGGETIYEIQITNRGATTAEQIQVTAALPPGMTVVRIESAGRYRMQGQQIQFETIASLAPQASTEMQVHVRGMAQGMQRIRAVMTCPTLKSAVTAEETTEVYGN